MTASQLTLLEDHVVVLGYGDVTDSLLEELDDDVDIVVVTRDTDTASSLSDDVNVLTGDPADEAVLEDARVDTARGVVVSGDDDARNVLAVLAARNVDPDVHIVATANEEIHVDKLDEVGADEVVSPRTIGGQLLGQSVMEADAAESGDTGDTSRADDDA